MKAVLLASRTRVSPLSHVIDQDPQTMLRHPVTKWHSWGLRWTIRSLPSCAGCSGAWRV